MTVFSHPPQAISIAFPLFLVLGAVFSSAFFALASPRPLDPKRFLIAETALRNRHLFRLPPRPFYGS